MTRNDKLQEAMRQVEAGKLSMSAAARLFKTSAGKRLTRQSLGSTFWSLHLKRLAERRIGRSKP